MKHIAYIFPGQASQFVGMGKDLYIKSDEAAALFEKANELLGFRISDIMIEGTEEELKQTNITQPSVFLHSIIKFKTTTIDQPPFAVAGHSLGEFSALVAAEVLSFEDGLNLVQIRASAMQEACENNPGSMAAIVGLDDAQIEQVCHSITDHVVIPANYNCPGQLVISGSLEGLKIAEQKLIEAGAKRVIVLNVGGAFHSPLMEPAKVELEEAIASTNFKNPICAVYQNITAKPYILPHEIKQNLILQLTAPVRWTQSVIAMIDDGATSFTEIGPGNVLQGLVKKINREIETYSA